MSAVIHRHPLLIVLTFIESFSFPFPKQIIIRINIPIYDTIEALLSTSRSSSIIFFLYLFIVGLFFRPIARAT